MPKVVTYSDRPLFFRRDDGGEYPVEEYKEGEGVKPLLHSGLQVLWTRNGFVEVGGATFYATTGGMEEDATKFFLTLDRAGINRVIRTLQQARNQAYGKDA